LENWQEFFIQYWLEISMPVAMLLASLWLRATSFHLLERWRAKGDGEPVAIFIASTRSATRLWVLLLTLFVANHSLWVLSEWRTFANRVIGTIFILSLFWISIRLGQGLLRVYLSKAGLPTVMLPWLLNLVRVGVAFTVAMLLLDIWGISTTPIILVLAVVALVAALGLKDAVPNLLASFRLTSRLSFHKGDFIKLDTGEEGYVTEVAWGRTRIRGLDNSLIVLPNNKIVKSVVVNYGRPLKVAKHPFRFNTHHHLEVLTGVKVATVRELVDALKEVPGSVVYYHTHHFIEEHHFLIPEPANDFSLWVSGELGNRVLGEKLASIDIFAFPTIRALRKRLVEVMEEHLAQNPDSRRAPSGQELYLVSVITVIVPTPYVARDLRGFVEALGRVSTSSIYFHVFEARLRLQQGENDFSIWIEDSLGDKDLAGDIASLDPYSYSLEGLRSAIIRMVEAHL
jgi:hypothetical protein